MIPIVMHIFCIRFFCVHIWHPLRDKQAEQPAFRPALAAVKWTVSKVLSYGQITNGGKKNQEKNPLIFPFYTGNNFDFFIFISNQLKLAKVI